MTRIPIAVFLRAPIPGRCKTRLAATIGDDAAAALSAAFVIDTLTRLRTIDGLDPELHVADSLAHPFFAALRARFDLPAPILQREGDLGARMQHALDRGGPSLIIGSDAPTLPASIVRAAIDSTSSADVVLSPAADGGYVLIGGAAPARFLRDPRIRWSTEHTLADTMRAARTEALELALTAPHYDVDTAVDLALLAMHLALDPSAAPATAEVLARGSGMPTF